MGHYHDLQRDLARSGRELRKFIPEAYAGFSALHEGTMDAGDALSRVTKELIALSIAVAEQCDGCIAAHARSLVHWGGEPREVAEALGVALMMRGGPGSTEIAKAWAAFSEYYEKKHGGAPSVDGSPDGLTSDTQSVGGQAAPTDGVEGAAAD